MWSGLQAAVWGHPCPGQGGGVGAGLFPQMQCSSQGALRDLQDVPKARGVSQSPTGPWLSGGAAVL